MKKATRLEKLLRARIKELEQEMATWMQNEPLGTEVVSTMQSRIEVLESEARASAAELEVAKRVAEQEKRAAAAADERRARTEAAAEATAAAAAEMQAAARREMGRWQEAEAERERLEAEAARWRGEARRISGMASDEAAQVRAEAAAQQKAALEAAARRAEAQKAAALEAASAELMSAVGVLLQEAGRSAEAQVAAANLVDGNARASRGHRADRARVPEVDGQRDGRAHAGNETPVLWHGSTASSEQGARGGRAGPRGERDVWREEELGRAATGARREKGAWREGRAETHESQSLACAACPAHPLSSREAPSAHRRPLLAHRSLPLQATTTRQMTTTCSTPTAT